MGCGFWDMLAFMGGPMSMPNWMAARPPMARGDGVHLTRRGYVRVGMALTDALMADFDADEPETAKAHTAGSRATGTDAGRDERPHESDDAGPGDDLHSG
jgi:hypothetical protein